MKPVTLETEIRERHESMEDLITLLEELRKTCVLFIGKFQRIMFLGAFDDKAISHLCMAMETEALSIKKHADKLLPIQDKTILPLIDFDLSDYMDEVSEDIKQISKSIHIKDRMELDSYIVAEQEMWTSLMELYSSGAFSSFLIDCKAIFQSMLSRYEKDNEDVLSFYAGEIDDVKEARKQLREDYKDDKAVKLWRENAGCIEKAIDAMRDSGCTELDLLPLFAYVARHRLLEGMAKEGGRVTVIENHFHEGSQNVEHIEKQINTPPLAPPKGGVQEYRAWGKFLEQNK